MGQVNTAHLWLDIAELEKAYARINLVPGDRIHAAQAEQLRAIVPIYRGELLEGCYEDWCIYERERIKSMYMAILEALLAFCEANCRPREGLLLGEQLLRHDRAHERAHYLLMRLYHLAGDRCAALRQYQRCQQALRAELDAEPGPQIRSLSLRIRKGQGTDRSPAATVEVEPRPYRDDGQPAVSPGAVPHDGQSSPDDSAQMVAARLQSAIDAISVGQALIKEGLRSLGANGEVTREPNLK